MLRLIVGGSLRFRFLAVAAAAGMMFFGIGQLRDMPVDVFPEFAPPRVEIQTEGPGMSTTEVEDLITIPMEERLRGTPELDVMRSKTVEGLSSILLIFKRGTDLLHARQLVQERLALAIPSLPASSGMPVMLQPLSATSRVMKIGVSSKQYSMMDLSMIAYWTMRFRMMSVPGVANVAIWGERIKALMVQVDPAKLRAHDVSLDEVEEVTSEALDYGLLPYSTAAKNRIEGVIDTPNQRLGIEHITPVYGPEELARVAVKQTDKGTVRLGDLGNVVWDHPALIGDAVINDGPGLLLIVEKLPWANTLDVTRGVEAAIDGMRPGLPGIDIDTTIFRPATFIEMSIENLTHAMLIGCLLVVLVLVLFLFEWRTALISLVAIPLSLMAAALVLYVTGATINTMILAGLVIAIGVVVDDAIIDIENIARRLRQHRTEGIHKPTARVILEASLEVRSAIIYATLIDAAALVPVFFMEGLSGSFFKPLALSYALAVIASMFVALTVTPALALILLRKAKIERRESPVARWLQRRYERVLARIIRRPRPAFAAVAAVGLVGIIVWPQLGQSLLPSFKERDFLMHWVTKPGTSHDEMYRITAQASRELRQIPGVQNFGAHIGRAVVADEVVGVNFTENWVSVDPKADYNKTVAAINKTVEGYPGIYRDVQTYLKERIREVLTGAGEAIVVRIFGPELSVLRSKADEVKKALTGINGLVELHSELQVDVPHISIKVDLAKAERYGLKPGDVRRAAATIFAGIEVTDIHREGKVYDVMVWSTPESRHNVTSVSNFLLDTPGGGHVRLGDVAAVEVAATPNEVRREGLSRRIDVVANVRGRDLGSVAGDVERRLQQVEFPLEYHPEILGEFAERKAAEGRLLALAAVAVIAILLLLQASFRSTRLALLSFLTLPSALVGGVLAALASGGVISLGSLVGFFTVLGIAARNGIMMINHYQHLERFEGEPFGPGLVLRGAKERLSPILMTALATGLALVPLWLAGDIPGHEIEHPLAVVILGGLVTSTLLNLFVTPSIYLRFGKSNRPSKPEPAPAEPAPA
ncbi:MAG: efflux RND transporter permease subunit [Chloroflexota bacterium]|nr:efflux RND transporter permease subunit [Chloroflexota bacterium]